MLITAKPHAAACARSALQAMVAGREWQPTHLFRERLDLSVTLLELGVRPCQLLLQLHAALSGLGGQLLHGAAKFKQLLALLITMTTHGVKARKCS